MIVQLSQVCQWLELSPGKAVGEACGYSIDSRTVQPGELFFAIRGPTHDGHDYVLEAFRRGAVAAVVRAGFDAKGAGCLLRVDDPAAALRAVGAQARREWGGTVIAVTGSSGKTTTKDVIATLLEDLVPVAKSEGNLNNEYGLPLSLLRVPCEARVAVVEIGINHAGEMRPLAELAAPDIAVVTNVGSAHLGNFASVDEIAGEKRGLVEALRKGGTAVLNADDRRVSEFRETHDGPALTFGIERPADVRAVDVVELGAKGVRFSVSGQSMTTLMPGRHNVYNILAAVAAVKPLGFSSGRLGAAVGRLRPSAMRGIVHQRGGVTLIDDCYNANPPAMAAMLDVLRRTPGARRIAVLGEMRELGAASRDLHRQVGRAVADAGINHLIAVCGDAAEIARSAGGVSEFCESPRDAARVLAGMVKPGDVVLLKASRGVGLEEARDGLLKALGQPERTAV